MKVVINVCFGGFSVSKAAAEFMAARGNAIAKDELQSERFYGSLCDVERNDPDLVAAVETLGAKAASGAYAELKVVDIPDGIEYEIAEYDGTEHIAEKHRTWY